MQTKYNQLLIPHSLCAEDSFGFYSKGKDVWRSGGDFREITEDKFRYQLEMSDRLQGFQITCDAASG